MPTIEVPVSRIEELYECQCGSDSVAIRAANRTTTYQFIICTGCWIVRRDTDFDGKAD